MTRHQRRKYIKLLQSLKAAKLKEANDAFERAATVKRNLAQPPIRNFYPQSSMADLLSHSHRGYVCRAAGGKAAR